MDSLTIYKQILYFLGTDQLNFSAKFHIDELETFDTPEPFKVTARFCVPDPCLGGKGIQKYCPEGMELYINGTSENCRQTRDVKLVTDHLVFKNLSYKSSV